MTWYVILVSDMDDLAVIPELPAAAIPEPLTAIPEPPADIPEPPATIPEFPAARVKHYHDSPYYNFTPQQKSQTSVKLNQLERHNKDNVEEIKKQFEVFILH